MSGPKTAMVLAAGLGTRMRPLTDDRPKALVQVAGLSLIDHMLDRLEAAGVEKAVVNVHAFADRLEAHLTERRAPQIVISDERARLMETGGGLKQARGLLGEAPVFVANIDSVWIERGAAALPALVQAWDPTEMEVCLLLTATDKALGFDGPGDFFKDEAGRLSFRGAAARAPFAYIGVHIAKPQIVDGEPLEPFSLTRIWRGLAERGRLYGVVLDGDWMHVGDPDARAAAEARLRSEPVG